MKKLHVSVVKRREKTRVNESNGAVWAVRVFKQRIPNVVVVVFFQKIGGIGLCQ